MTAAFLSGFTLTSFPAPSVQGEQLSAEATLAEYARGVLAELDGDTKAAREYFESTLRKDPRSFPVARKTAQLQQEGGDIPSAAGTLRHYAKAHPDHLPSQLYYADFLEEHTARDVAAQRAAMDLLSGANQRFPHDHEIYTRLINLHENLGQRERSLALFEEQMKVEEAGPEHWMALGPVARTLLPGNSPGLREAEDLIMEKLVESGVHDSSVARSACYYYRTTGRLHEAIGVVRQHLELKPDSLDLRTRLGILQLYIKQEVPALETLHETIEIDPDQALAHKTLAQYYSRKDQPRKALHHRYEFLRIAGGTADTFLQLADQLLDLGESRKARLILEKARFDHPEDPALAARLAIATLRDGDTAAASRLFRQAEALAGSSGLPSVRDILDPEFQIEFAGALRRSGDLAGAENRLRSAIRGIPPEQPRESARALRELARLWIDQKRNLAPAASLLKRAEALDPDNPENRKLLERTREKNP